MRKIGFNHHPKCKPNGIIKADYEAQKSGDLLKQDFTSAELLKKCVTDITKIRAKDRKLYVSATFDCFDAAVLRMDTNMKMKLCERTLENAVRVYPALKGTIIHSDRGSQYISGTYRRSIAKYGIFQSMYSTRARCHDNARCESTWARIKEKLLYGKHDT